MRSKVEFASEAVGLLNALPVGLSLVLERAIDRELGHEGIDPRTLMPFRDAIHFQRVEHDGVTYSFTVHCVPRDAAGTVVVLAITLNYPPLPDDDPPGGLTRTSMSVATSSIRTGKRGVDLLAARFRHRV